MSRRTTILIAIIWLRAAGSELGSTEAPSRSGEAEQLVFKATNEFRIKNNLQPLIWDQRLSDIAYGHSADMIVRDFFDHVNPDGQAPTERIHRQHRQFIGNTGENVSVIVAAPPLDAMFISENAMSGWLKSPPHRENILDRAFTHIGIGVALSGVEAKLTQNFMQVRGILKEPVPESLKHDERLTLEVIPFPQNSPKAEKYIMEAVRPGSEHKEPAVWDLSTRRPSVAPGSYTIQFCFPAPQSRFLEVFPGPQIEILK